MARRLGAGLILSAPILVILAIPALAQRLVTPGGAIFDDFAGQAFNKALWRENAGQPVTLVDDYAAVLTFEQGMFAGVRANLTSAFPIPPDFTLCVDMLGGVEIRDKVDPKTLVSGLPPYQEGELAVSGHYVVPASYPRGPAVGITLFGVTDALMLTFVPQGVPTPGDAAGLQALLVVPAVQQVTPAGRFPVPPGEWAVVRIDAQGPGITVTVGDKSARVALSSAVNRIQIGNFSLQLTTKLEGRGQFILDNFLLMPAGQRVGVTGELADGSSYLEREDWKNAEVRLRRAAMLDPENAEVLAKYGLAVGHTRSAMEGLTACQKALTLAPNSYYAHLCTGRLLHDMLKSAEAVKELEQAVTLFPGSAEAHYWLGIALCDFERRLPGQTLETDPRAETEFNKATDLNPAFAPAYEAMGKLLDTRGLEGDAVKWYLLALEKDPDLPHSRLRASLFLPDPMDIRGNLVLIARYHPALGEVFLAGSGTPEGMKRAEAAMDRLRAEAERLIRVGVPRPGLALYDQLISASALQAGGSPGGGVWEAIHGLAKAYALVGEPALAVHEMGKMTGGLYDVLYTPAGADIFVPPGAAERSERYNAEFWDLVATAYASPQGRRPYVRSWLKSREGHWLIARGQFSDAIGPLKDAVMGGLPIDRTWLEYGWLGSLAAHRRAFDAAERYLELAVTYGEQYILHLAKQEYVRPPELALAKGRWQEDMAGVNSVRESAGRPAKYIVPEHDLAALIAAAGEWAGVVASGGGAGGAAAPGAMPAGGGAAGPPKGPGGPS